MWSSSIITTVPVVRPAREMHNTCILYNYVYLILFVATPSHLPFLCRAQYLTNVLCACGQTHLPARMCMSPSIRVLVCCVLVGVQFRTLLVNKNSPKRPLSMIFPYVVRVCVFCAATAIRRDILHSLAFELSPFLCFAHTQIHRSSTKQYMQPTKRQRTLCEPNSPIPNEKRIHSMAVGF